MFWVDIFIGFDYFFLNKPAKLLRVGKCFLNYCLRCTGFLAGWGRGVPPSGLALRNYRFLSDSLAS